MLHVAMAMITAGVVYCMFMCYRYAAALEYGLRLSDVHVFRCRVNNTLFAQQRQMAESDHIQWATFWLPCIALTIGNTLLLWWLLSGQTVVDQGYIIISALTIAGIFTRVITKNFTDRWFIEWSTSIADARDQYEIDQMQTRLLDIVDQLDALGTNPPADRLSSLQIELLLIATLTEQIQQRAAVRDSIAEKLLSGKDNDD